MEQDKKRGLLNTPSAVPSSPSPSDPPLVAGLQAVERVETLGRGGNLALFVPALCLRLRPLPLVPSDLNTNFIPPPGHENWLAVGFPFLWRGSLAGGSPLHTHPKQDSYGLAPRGRVLRYEASAPRISQSGLPFIKTDK